MPATPEDDFLAELSAAYRRVGSRFFIDVDGEAAAWVDLEREPELVYIRLIMVRPEARRLGLGRSIISKLAATADDCGAMLVLSLAHDEPWLHDLYHAAGFAVCDEICQGDDVMMTRSPQRALEFEPDF